MESNVQMISTFKKQALSNYKYFSFTSGVVSSFKLSVLREFSTRTCNSYRKLKFLLLHYGHITVF